MLLLFCPLENWPHHFTPGHSSEDGVCAGWFDIIPVKWPISITWSVRDTKTQENKFWRRSGQAINLVATNEPLKPSPSQPC